VYLRAGQRRLSGAGVVAVTVDPGSVFSGIWNNSSVFGRPPFSWLLQVLPERVRRNLLCRGLQQSAPFHLQDTTWILEIAVRCPVNQNKPMHGMYKETTYSPALWDALPYFVHPGVTRLSSWRLCRSHTYAAWFRGA